MKSYSVEYVGLSSYVNNIKVAYIIVKTIKMCFSLAHVTSIACEK